MRALLLAALLAVPARAMRYDVGRARTSAGRQVNVVRMTGIIDVGEWAGWIDAVSRLDPALDALFVVSSPGGSVPGGFFLMTKIDAYLAERAAAGRRDWILADADCSSMCVPVYFLFPRRLSRPGARFGLHSVSMGGIADDPGQTDLYLGRMTDAARRRGEDGFLRWLQGVREQGAFSTHELTPFSGRALVEQGSGLVSPEGLADGVNDAAERLDASR